MSKDNDDDDLEYFDAKEFETDDDFKIKKPLFAKDDVDEMLAYRDQAKTPKITLNGEDLFKDCLDIFLDNKDNPQKIKAEILARLKRTIESIFLETDRASLEPIINQRLEALVKQESNKFGGRKPTKEYIAKFRQEKYKEVTDQVTKEDLHPDKEFIRKKVYQNELNNFTGPLTAMVDQAVDKLGKEIEKSNNSLDKKTKDRYWFNIPDKICDYLASMFRNVSLIMGAEPTAKELFEKAAKYSENVKLNLEKSRNSLANARGPLKELITKAKESKFKSTIKEVEEHDKKVIEKKFAASNDLSKRTNKFTDMLAKTTNLNRTK